MHDENNNEELFIMMSKSKNIKKKLKKFSLIRRSKRISGESIFNSCIRKFINYFCKRRRISRNECNRFKTEFIKSFTNL